MAINQQKNQTDNKQHIVEARDIIFIKTFPVFLPPRPGSEIFPYKLLYLRVDRYYARWPSLPAWAWEACDCIEDPGEDFLLS